MRPIDNKVEIRVVRPDGSRVIASTRNVSPVSYGYARAVIHEGLRALDLAEGRRAIKIAWPNGSEEYVREGHRKASPIESFGSQDEAAATADEIRNLLDPDTKVEVVAYPTEAVTT